MLSDISIIERTVVVEDHTNHAKDGSEYDIEKVVRVVAERSDAVRL